MTEREYIVGTSEEAGLGNPTSAERVVKVKVNTSGIYTMQEAAQILHVNCSYLHELTKRENDPFPARLLSWKKQGLFVLDDEMHDWVKRNAPLRSQRRDFAREHARVQQR